MPKSPTNPDQHAIDPFTELVTTQKLQHQDVMKEIAGVKSDIKEVKEGITLQIAEQNVRIIALETFRQTKAADEKIAEWNASAEWVTIFQGRWKWIAGLIGLAAAVLGWVVNYLYPIHKGG